MKAGLWKVGRVNKFKREHGAETRVSNNRHGGFLCLGREDVSVGKALISQNESSAVS